MTATLLLSFLLLQIAPFPQTPQADPAGAPATPAALEGLVIRVGTSTPVTGAEAALIPVGGGAALAATTDGAGKFVFAEVPPGPYRLSATRPGYVHTEYGQRAPELGGTTLRLEPGEYRRDLVVPMTPTGVISGRIYDRYGEPVVRAGVQALRYRYREGSRVLSPVGSAQTNDLGEYRLFWMDPGEYLVSVTPTPGPIQMETAVFSMAGGMVSFAGTGGNVTIRSGVPVVGGVPVPPPPMGATHLVGGASTGYASVYYPGTTDAASATTINLGSGIDYSGVDMLIVETPTSTIRGRVVSGSGSLDGVRGVTVRLVRQSSLILEGGPQWTSGVDENGAFEISNVLPGSYDLVAALQRPNFRRIISEGEGRIILGEGVGGVAGGEDGRMYARVPIQVGEADIDGVNLMLRPGYDIQGRIRFDGDTTDPGLSGVNLQLQAERVLYGVPTPQVQWGDNWTFSMGNVPPSHYRVRVTGLPANTYIREVRLGAENLIDTGLNLDREPSGRLDIVVGADAGTLDATVLDRSDQRAGGVRVAMVPNAPRRARTDLYRTAVSDDSGVVHFEGVAPGDYKVFAWDRVDSGAWQHPDFIRNYDARGEPALIPPFGSEAVTVRLIATGN